MSPGVGQSGFVTKLTAGEFKLGLGFAGLWLILLIAFSLTTAVFIFSAAQFQLRFANFVLNGDPLSVWKAEELRRQWSDSRIGSRAAIEAAKNELNDITPKLTQARGLRGQAQQAVIQSRNESTRIRRELIEKVEKIDAGFARTLNAMTGDQFVVATRGRDTLRVDSSILPDVDKYIEAQGALLRNLNVSTARAEEFQGLLELVRSRQEAVKTAQDSARLTLPTSDSELQKEDQKGQIENAIYEFDRMWETRVGKIVHYLSLLPSDVLILLLVISMGLLGSSLQLNYIYVTKFEEKTPGFYIVRPLFGIITAFVIYIVAKAGIPLIADPTRVGASAPINPYFISFLAIISGLLSERALVSLVRVGSNYFRESDAAEVIRWARGNLTDEFKEAKRDPEKTRKLLKAKASEWEDWMQGKEPMPAGVQTMIAAVLGKPPRDLFTDIAPDADGPAKEAVADKQPEQGKPNIGAVAGNVESGTQATGVQKDGGTQDLPEQAPDKVVEKPQGDSAGASPAANESEKK